MYTPSSQKRWVLLAITTLASKLAVYATIDHYIVIIKQTEINSFLQKRTSNEDEQYSK